MSVQPDDISAKGKHTIRVDYEELDDDGAWQYMSQVVKEGEHIAVWWEAKGCFYANTAKEAIYKARLWCWRHGIMEKDIEIDTEAIWE